MRPTLRTAAAGLTLVFGVLVSCAQPGRQEIAVRAPGLPEAYTAMTVTWELVWWNGQTVDTKTLAEQRASDPVATTLPLSRDGAEVVVVQATARPEEGGSLAPLGGWVAAPDISVTLQPSFGRAAESVINVARRGLNPALINLERLHRTVIEECDGQPERLDQERLVAALGSGEMTRYAIRRRPRPGLEISLTAPRNDVWISHDTTQELIEGVWAEDRCYWVIPVAEGEVRHLWQWLPVATVSRGSAVVIPSVRLLTVGRDRDGHAFWFIKDL